MPLVKKLLLFSLVSTAAVVLWACGPGSADSPSRSTPPASAERPEPSSTRTDIERALTESPEFREVFGPIRRIVFLDPAPEAAKPATSEPCPVQAMVEGSNASALLKLTWEWRNSAWRIKDMKMEFITPSPTQAGTS